MQEEYSELKLFSKSQAAKYLGIGKEKLSALIQGGKLGVIDLEGSTKVPYIEIVRFLKQNLTYQTNNTGVFPQTKEIPPELIDEFDSRKIFDKIKEGVN